MAIASLGFTAANGDRLDFLASWVTVVSIQGFEGGTVQHRMISSPLRDGSRYLDSRKQEMFPLIIFEIEGATWEQLQSRRRQLAPLLRPKAGIGVLDYQPSSGLDAYAIDALVERRVPQAQANPAAQIERWTLQFRCHDPYWRAAVATLANVSVQDDGMDVPTEVPTEIGGLAGATTIANDGDVEAWPVVTATPAETVETPVIENLTTGQILTLSGLTIAAGETLEIDMLNQTVTLDGVSARQYVTADSEFWSLEIGDNNVKVSHTSGGASWSFSHFDRYEGI